MVTACASFEPPSSMRATSRIMTECPSLLLMTASPMSATDFGTARLLGVRANTVIATAVLLSAVIAAAVSILLTVQNPLVAPDFALKETIIVLVGVVVGGIDRLWTATLGGFSIGFATGVINGALPTDKTVFLPSVVFALVILVLLVRPSGLFARGGSSLVERV